MNVVVVSNRVARAKPDEPLAGGLAAALLPMVRDSGAIWVGSSGQSSSDASQARGSFARIEALGTGAHTLAVSCPFCLTMTTDGINARSGDMTVRDIAEILADALPQGAKTALPESTDGL